MDKLRIRQAIVVEGKYEQNALRQLVDTAIFTTTGFTGMKDPALLRLLPGPRPARALAACALCALFAALGFGRLVSAAYPVLGALCAGLLLLLCLPCGQYVSSSLR